MSGWLFTSRRILNASSDGLHDQLVALQLHLPPGDVERRDNLLVGRRRGVREDGLFERPVVPVEVLVAHQHHRALTQRRHRLVRRVGLVDAELGLAGSGSSRMSSSVGSLGRVAPAASPAPGTLHDRQGRRSAPSAPPPRPSPCAGGRKALKRAKPNHASSHRKIRSGLMARHSSITRRGLYTWPSKVQLVSVTVLTLSSVPAALQIEQRLLDRAQRHGAVHRVLYQRKSLDVVGLRPRQHDTVVVRLVAVAVGNHDVARLAAAPGATILLEVDVPLVHEEDALGAERARRLVLGFLDVAGGFEQAVESAAWSPTTRRGTGSCRRTRPCRGSSWTGRSTCRAPPAARGTCRPASARSS